jgi:preprotein translocase subunit SecE
VAVSKTVGCGFDPYHPCKILDPMANNRFVEYIKESYDELMHKVSWPTWSELQNSAVVVSVASLMIALVVFIMDKSFEVILKQFYSLF